MYGNKQHEAHLWLYYRLPGDVINMEVDILNRERKPACRLYDVHSRADFSILYWGKGNETWVGEDGGKIWHLLCFACKAGSFAIFLVLFYWLDCKKICPSSADYFIYSLISTQAILSQPPKQQQTRSSSLNRGAPSPSPFSRPPFRLYLERGGIVQRKSLVCAEKHRIQKY